MLEEGEAFLKSLELSPYSRHPKTFPISLHKLGTNMTHSIKLPPSWKNPL
jgi:hypothetical protein